MGMAEVRSEFENLLKATCKEAPCFERDKQGAYKDVLTRAMFKGFNLTNRAYYVRKKPEAADSWIVACSKDGKLTVSKNPWMHVTEELAIAEAERLSKNTGDTFVCLKTVSVHAPVSNRHLRLMESMVDPALFKDVVKLSKELFQTISAEWMKSHFFHGAWVSSRPDLIHKACDHLMQLLVNDRSAWPIPGKDEVFTIVASPGNVYLNYTASISPTGWVLENVKTIQPGTLCDHALRGYLDVLGKWGSK